jgi:hypothetical protein
MACELYVPDGSVQESVKKGDSILVYLHIYTNSKSILLLKQSTC